MQEMAKDIYHAQLPDRTRRQGRGAEPRVPDDDLQVHEVSERRQGIPALHDGKGADTCRGRRLRSATCATRSRRTRSSAFWTADPKNDAVSRLHEGHVRRTATRARWATRRRQRSPDFIIPNMVAEAAIGLEDAEGSGRAGAGAGGALLQGLIDRASRRERPLRSRALKRRVSHDSLDTRAGLRTTSHADAAARRDRASRARLALSPRARQPHVLGLLFMLPAAGAAAAVPHLSARARHLARLHRRQDRPRRRLDRPRELRVPVGRRRSRASRCSTRFSTRRSPASSSSGSGLWLALLLNKHLPFKSFFRAVVLLPFIVPTALSAIAFWWIYDSQFSIISWTLMRMGLIHRVHRFPRRPVACALLDDRRQRLARRALRGDHAAGRPADDLAVALRGGEPRRRARAGSSSAT